MLLETKSVKSNLHKPTIKKVPPSCGIFYVPSVVQGTKKYGQEVHFPTKHWAPFRFCERASKNGMGSRPPITTQKKAAPKGCFPCSWPILFGNQLHFNFGNLGLDTATHETDEFE